VVRRPYSYWVIPFGLTLYILSDPCDHSHSSSPEQQLCCSGLSVFIYGSHRLVEVGRAFFYYAACSSFVC